MTGKTGNSGISLFSRRLAPPGGWEQLGGLGVCWLGSCLARSLSPGVRSPLVETDLSSPPP
jgi:hypothetical protein